MVARLGIVVGVLVGSFCALPAKTEADEPSPALRAWRAAASVGTHRSVGEHGAMWSQLERAWYEKPLWGPSVGAEIQRRIGHWLHAGTTLRWERVEMDADGHDGSPARMDRFTWLAVASPHYTFPDSWRTRRDHGEVGIEVGLGWAREWWVMEGVPVTTDALRLRVGAFLSYVFGPVELGPRLTFARTFMGRVGRFDLRTDQSLLVVSYRIGVRW